MPSELMSDAVALHVDGSVLPLQVRVNPRAKRISLRSDAGGGVVLVLPSRRLQADGLRFAQSKAGWIRAQLSRGNGRMPFADGMTIPLLGIDYRVRHDPQSRNPVVVGNGEITVGGPASRLPDMLENWLWAEARRQTDKRSRDLAVRIGENVARVTVRDTRSRWGSCSHDGALSYCWRLVLAPEAVLDYVVAHEVAHLRIQDHSERFWRLVAELRPTHLAERRWLKRHGARLHLYG